MPITKNYVRQRGSGVGGAPAVTDPTVLKLTGDDAEGVLVGDLEDVTLTGSLHSWAKPAINVISSTVDRLETDSVDFSRCDFKYNSIRESRFISTKFNTSSFAYNTVVDSSFESCSFADTDIHECEFRDVAFTGCDFTHVIAKSCSFVRCSFNGCSTSNKVFETSLFIDTHFDQTEIQVDTLEENFGITSAMYVGSIRGGRPNAGPSYAVDDLSALLRESRSALGLFNIDYFLRGTLLEGSPYLDKAIAPDTWLSSFKTAGGFVATLAQFVDFLLGLYERDQVPVHTIVRFHTTIAVITGAIESQGTHNSALTRLNGAFMSLARVVDAYLTTLEPFDLAMGNQVALVVEGGDSEAYYYDHLRPLFERADAMITKLVPHNSPWDLVISLISRPENYWFPALLLATRVRIELSRIKDRSISKLSALPNGAPPRLESGEGKGAIRKPEVSEVEQVFMMDVGIPRRDPKSNPNFQIQAYLPGNLVADLRLDIASRQIAVLRKTIKDLF